MTVVGLPGQLDSDKLLNSFTAVLQPFSGVVLACATIVFGAARSTNTFRRALFAGALCEDIESNEGITPQSRKIHTLP
jgi:hypothetical protein